MGIFDFIKGNKISKSKIVSFAELFLYLTQSQYLCQNTVYEQKTYK